MLYLLNLSKREHMVINKAADTLVPLSWSGDRLRIAHLSRNQTPADWTDRQWEEIAKDDAIDAGGG